MRIQPRHRNRCRTLSMDVLEGRQLLAGNVTAALWPLGSANLQINLSTTLNQSITISQPSAGIIRVAGDRIASPPDVTLVNSVGYTDFAASSVSSITVSTYAGVSATGNQTVNLNTLKISGKLDITLGSGVDTVNSSDVQTGQLNITGALAGVKANTFTLRNTMTGASTIKGGSGIDKISLLGGTFGTTSISTAGNASDFVTVGASTALPTSPAKPITLAQLAITEGNGNNTINVTSPSITNTANITVGNGTNKITMDNSAFGSSVIVAGSGSNAIDVSNNSVKKVGGLSVTSGLGATSRQAVNVSGNSIPLGPLTLNLGNQVSMLSPTASTLDAVSNTVGKLLKVTVGDNFGTLNLKGNLALAGELINAGNSTTGAIADTVTGVQNLTVGLNSNLTVSKTVSGDQAIMAGNASLVSVSSTVSGYQEITVGDNSTLSVSSAVGGGQVLSGANSVNVAVTGSVGSDSTLPNRDQTINLGNLSTLNDAVASFGGDVSVTAGDQATVILGDPTLVAGILAPKSDIVISVGSFAVEVAVENTTCNTLAIMGGDGSADPSAPTFYLLTGDVITGEDASGNGLDLRFGDGNNLVQLGTYVDPLNAVTPQDSMIIDNGINILAGAAGVANVYVANTSAGYGTIDGGSSLGDYYDLGGNTVNWVVQKFHREFYI